MKSGDLSVSRRSNVIKYDVLMQKKAKKQINMKKILTKSIHHGKQILVNSVGHRIQPRKHKTFV